MAELSYIKLGEEDIERELKSFRGWSIESGRLTKEFKFESYLSGVEFVSKVGAAAENLNHHPDIHLFWRRVVVAMNTHDVGGISPFDFELARRVDALTAPAT